MLSKCCALNREDDASAIRREFAKLHDIDLTHLDDITKWRKLCKGDSKLRNLKPKCPSEELKFRIVNETYKLYWDKKNIIRDEADFCIDYNYGLHLDEHAAYIGVCLDDSKTK